MEIMFEVRKYLVGNGRNRLLMACVIPGVNRRVWVSSAAYWAWGVAGLAIVAAGWHIWAITETPDSSIFWVVTVFDLLVACTAFGVGLQWPRYAVFDDEGIVLNKQRIRYEAITELRFGDVSAKPFWLAFWIPMSLVGGAIVALIPRDTFDRQVIEINTEARRARFRWRKMARHDAFADAVREARPDLESVYGLDGNNLAVDFTPRMSVGGGFLAFGLAMWVFFAGWLSIQLFDMSTEEGPFSPQATDSALRRITSGMTGYAPLPGVAANFTEWRCRRTNGWVLGDSPDVIDLHVKLVADDMPKDTADAIEAKVRRDAGMGTDDFLQRVDTRPDDTDVEVDIPQSNGLYIEISTGCVNRGDLGPLHDDLRKMATAIGATG